MKVPKSYKIRHSILTFLTNKRTEQQLKDQDLKTCQFTVAELSKHLKFDEKSIDTQLNMLWFDKLVINIADTKPTKYMILPEGMAVASSMKLLNEGKLLNSQLFNNFSSGVFQILVGLTAILTLYFNLTSVNNLDQEVSNIKSSIKNIEEHLNNNSKLNKHIIPIDTITNE